MLTLINQCHLAAGMIQVKGKCTLHADTKRGELTSQGSEPCPTLHPLPPPAKSLALPAVLEHILRKPETVRGFRSTSQILHNFETGFRRLVWVQFSE